MLYQFAYIAIIGDILILTLERRLLERRENTMINIVTESDFDAETLCCGVSREALLSGTVKDFSKEAIEIALKHYDDEEYVKMRQQLMKDIQNGD